jgi:hypothetical protein
MKSSGGNAELLKKCSYPSFLTSALARLRDESVSRRTQTVSSARSTSLLSQTIAVIRRVQRWYVRCCYRANGIDWAAESRGWQLQACNAK